MALAAAGAAPAQGAQRKGFYDSRVHEHAADQAAPAFGRARAALARELGPRAVVDVDPLTGATRMLARLDGTLTGPRRGDAVTLAKRYVRDHLSALGLTAGDVGSLGDLRRVPVAGGEQVRWRQYHDGIPALDGDLRVTVTDDGEILNVVGAPQHALNPAAAAPRLDALEALRAAGATDVPPIVAGPSGPRRTTRFAGGDEAALVLFGSRLAWRVIHKASPDAVWDVVVDAGGGRVLRRANQVKDITVFERYPGDAHTTDYDFVSRLWLPPAATQLSGPNVHAWADVDDSDTATADEEVVPGSYPLAPFGGCTPLPCTWDSGDPGSWEDNRNQGTVQTFYYVNRFHDWMRSEFDFDPGEVVHVQTFDGAALDPKPLNNANTFTPPVGQSPAIQMYLFDTRDVHGGDDAAIVYHEYTHAATNRMVTDGDGWGALTSPQAAAMGEGWSDYFAFDFLVRWGYQPNTATVGELDLDAYTQSESRFEALDCPVEASGGNCGGGGYIYADFGRIAGEPEVHADGEIWAQTLWELRGRLGPAVARDLIFAALPLAPPEPSFLEMRNAILLADQAAGGTHAATIWDVFAHRGMGWFASTRGSSDVNPTASTLPLPSGSPGSVTGRVADADNRRPIAGAAVRVGGHDTLGPDLFTATTAADGAFSLGPLPSGTYGAVTVSAADGHDPETIANLTVPRAGLEVRLRRNWVAQASGAEVAGVNGVAAETLGCRAEQAIDQDPGTGFSVGNDGSAPELVFRLPRLVTVTGLAADPGNSCGDPAGSTTTRFAIGLSEDGATWSEREYALDVHAAHQRNALAVGDGAGRVRFVRLRLLGAANPFADYIDFTDLSVYGNALPGVTLAAPASGEVGKSLVFEAQGAQDADGAIVQYRWDFDGNGSVDRTTSTPATAFAYAAAGSYAPAVTVVDDRGGEGRATGRVAVTQPPPPPRFRDPVIVLPRTGRRARVIVRVRCEAACTGTVRLRVDKRTARKLRLGRVRTLASKRIQLRSAGERRITIKLSRKVVRRLKRARARSLKASLSASVVDVRGRSASAKRIVRIRR